MDFKYKNADESPGLLLWQASTLWRRSINSALSGTGITHTQYVILAVTYYLTKLGERTTQTSISNMSMIDTMTISNSLKLMEKKGLIFREEDVIDSRAKVLKCTDLGIELLGQANGLVEQVDAQFFSLEHDNMYQLIRLLSLLKNANEPDSKNLQKN